MIVRTRTLVLALLLGSCLVLPASALAKSKPGGCPPAICVYTEQQKTPTGSQVLGQGSSKPTPLPSSAGKALASYSGKDKSALSTLATSPAYSIGRFHHLASAPTGKSQAAAGAFDIGTGATALFYFLAVSGALVAIVAGVRLFRRS